MRVRDKGTGRGVGGGSDSIDFHIKQICTAHSSLALSILHENNTISLSIGLSEKI